MQVVYTQTAARQLADLPKEAQARIAGKMRFYFSASNPFIFAEKLTNFSLYRFRVGDYRIVIEVRSGVAFVMFIKKRDKAYKNL